MEKPIITIGSIDINKITAEKMGTITAEPILGYKGKSDGKHE